MTSRTWASLAPSTKKRYAARGIHPNTYNKIKREGRAGLGKLKEARGHGTTPERPQRAANRPDLYREYLQRSLERGTLPAGITPEDVAAAKPSGTASDLANPLEIRGADNELVKVLINPKSGRMKVERFSFDGTTPDEVAFYDFRPDEFAEVVKRVRDLQFVVTVTSDPI